MKKLTLLLFCLWIFAQVDAQRINVDKIVDHISFLSSDKLQGRGTGTEDEKVAAAYIAGQFRAMKLLPKGNKSYYYDFTYNHKVGDPHGTDQTAGTPRKSRNVVGFLDNGAPNTVVIGAHFDHLGLGYDKNSLDIEPQDKIHNGADDNASGVAGVIELARYFSNNGVKEKVNFLFMTFSGEELGLIGSKKWCEQPTIPLEKISYMINMDMIGRLNDTSRKLLVYGVGTAAEFIPSLEQVNQNFVFKFDSAGVGPSDQTSFYLKDIPVLHFFTGQHSDYHKPTDDADKINHKGEAMILELIVDMVFKLEHSTKLKFYTTKSPESSNVSFKVTLGIMPDYTFDGPGVRVDGVGENKPAAIAGLQKGDVILTMANEELADVKAYMKVLSKFSKGQETEIVIDRNGQRMRKMVRFK